MELSAALQHRVTTLRGRMTANTIQSISLDGTLLNLVQDLDAQGYVRLSDRLLKEYVSLSSIDTLWFNLVHRLIERGDLDGALHVLDQINAKGINPLETHYALHQVLQRKGDLAASKQHLEKVLLHDIDYLDALQIYRTLL